MAEYAMKCWPDFFNEIQDGRKRHDLRRSDRDFVIGDVLLLKEYDYENEAYTGREHRMVVSYITDARSPCAFSNQGLLPGFCILSLMPMPVTSVEA